MTFATEQSSRVATLLDMLRFMRPAGSKGERRFIRQYLLPLGCHKDHAGNLILQIGANPRVLWSCHTDTVHRGSGYQAVMCSAGIVTLSPGSPSNCLGADDTAGVWLMREMILAKRPGLYVFHRGEECGGIGSSYIAQSTPDLLAGIDYAIALDRAGTSDVITHQGWGRCCSDMFANALARKLGMSYRGDDTGVFTDTANYVDIVPECTNLSVGYHDQHRPSESLNLSHILALREVLCSLDVSDLPVSRKPGVYDDDWFGRKSYVCDAREFKGFGKVYDQRRLVDLVLDHPDVAADILQDYGVTAETMLDEIYARTGRVPF